MRVYNLVLVAVLAAMAATSLAVPLAQHTPQASGISNVRIALYRPRVDGVVDPLSVVTLTLTTASGEVLGESRQMSDASGLFTADIYAGEKALDVPIEPGAQLTISTDGGATQSIPIPAFRAQADAGRDTVTGGSVSRATIRVTAGGDPDGPGKDIAPVTREIPADETGTFAVSFSGDVDLVPGMAGTVEVETDADVVFHGAWSIPAIQQTQTRVSGNGPAGRVVTAAVLDASGAVKARDTDRVSNSGYKPWGAWSVKPVDGDGLPPQAEAGDILQLIVGDDELRVPIPVITAVRHLTEDTIAGHASIPGRLSLSISNAQGRQEDQIETDARGFFDHRFSAQRDLTYRDVTELALTQGAHVFRRRLQLPGLHLARSESLLSGSIEPSLALTVTVASASGVIRASHTLTAGEDALFSVVLRGADDEPLELHDGDVVSVSTPAGRATQLLILEVPELSLTFDVLADTAFGRADPSGKLTIELLEADQLTVLTSAEAPVREDGTYRISLDRAGHPLGGLLVRARYLGLSGHYVSITKAADAAQAEPLYMPWSSW